MVLDHICNDSGDATALPLPAMHQDAPARCKGIVHKGQRRFKRLRDIVLWFRVVPDIVDMETVMHSGEVAFP